MRVIDRVEALSEDILKNNDSELVDIEFKKEGSVKILRLYVDKTEGRINLDELSSINRQISDKLDEEDFIEEEYTLEVSSPGVNRVIKKEKDFIRFRGEKVDVALYAKIDGRKKFVGILKDFSDNKVYIEVDGEELQIPIDSISKTNLHFEF